MVSRRQRRPWAGAVVRRTRSALFGPRESRPAGGTPPASLSAVERLEGRTLLAADPVISEFLASNGETTQDQFGVYSDWIEIYNRGDAAVNLDGWFLTDDSSNLTQWRLPAVNLPAGGYLVVFASGKDLAVAGQELHANFQLDADGDYLGLVRPDGVTVNHAYDPAYPNQDEDISYGLTNETQASSGVQYLTRPTPGARNDANAPEPVFSIRSRTFTSPLSLTLSLPTGAPTGAEIRYTTNNSAPTATSTRYVSPISISNSTIVRAQVYAPGRSPGPVVSQTYVALDASVQSFNSNLPVVVMDTFGGGFNDTTLTPVSAYIIDTAAADGRAEMLDGPDFAGRGGLRYRGQSSQGFPKHPYAFETWDESNGDKSVSILGMPAESDWILYNPYSEKSLMQNYLAYMWSNRMGQYAVRTRYVELFVNTAAPTTSTGKVNYANDYQGVYILMEKIKIDDDRVDIDKLTPADNAAPEVTGGYIWKKDKWDAGEVGFTAGGQTYQYFEPAENEITAAQKAYLSGYINEFASVLNGANYRDPVNGYAKYIDVDSWIDHHIMVELTKNIDGFRLSTYYHKDRNGKIKMGPIWDYNLSLGNADYATGQNPTGWYHDTQGDGEYPYWRRLFSDPAFAQKYQDRWQQLRKNELSTDRLMADIDGLVTLLSDGNGNYPVGNNPPQVPNNPVVRNFQKWRVLGTYVWPNGFYDAQGRWIEDVRLMKNWLRQRLDWWDRLYPGMPAIAPGGGAMTGPQQVTITAPGGATTVDTPLLTRGAPAKAIVPTEEMDAAIGTTWRDRTGFDDSGWVSGSTGVGYDADPPGGGGDYTADLGLNLEMRNVNATAYLRVPFLVTNPASIQQLILRVNYDDAFVAYLNGVEVARTANVPADLSWNSGTVNNQTRNATSFEEFDVSEFKNLLVSSNSGPNVLAFHALNAGSGSSDLLVLPELVARSTGTGTGAPIYYTTDGSDPRLPGGALSPTARLYSAPFTVSGTTRVRARTFQNNRWSGLADELYDYGESRLRISELMYNPAPATPGTPYLPGDFEYVELLNTGTAAMDLAGMRFDKGIEYTFPAGTTLAPGGYIVIARNRAAFQARYGAGVNLAPGTFNGALSDGGERVRLLGRVGETIHDFNYSDDWYKQTDGEGWSLTVADSAQALAAWGTKDGWRASEARMGTPGGTDAGLRPNSVVINEVMSNPTASNGDWVELRNTTNAAVNIGNWWLSDSRTNLQKYRIPAGTTIPANGFVVFTQASHFGSAFSFAADGEGVYLSSGDAGGNLGGYRVDETFGAIDPNVTFGRHVKSTGGADFTAMSSATQGAANPAPLVGPVVINEIMYFPPAGKSEYIELRNITGSAVSLFFVGSPAVTWRLSGGIDFNLPSGASIPADGYAIISAVDPALFRQQYPNVPAGVPVWGPFTLADGSNVLSDGGESIRLQRPNSAAATRVYIDVDRVAYDDEAPWPADTKGFGQSLAKRGNSAGYGNDPANWDAERQNGSPGEANLAPDFVAPTADVINVTPDPRTTTVDTITIVFSERVTGLDLADLRLTRNGEATNLLTAAQTLTPVDGGTTWRVGNLAPLTLSSGQYLVTLAADGSGVRDAAGNPLGADASDDWTMNNPDASGPTANITDVLPDPRRSPVTNITIVFSEPVTGFDVSDLTLTRDGGPNLLSQSHTLGTTDNRTFTLGVLSNQTNVTGVYLLTLRFTGTGIKDAAGNDLAAGATDQWTLDLVTPTAQIVAVSPDPRRNGVDSVRIVFSEPVTGFDLSDLSLTVDGGVNLLVGGQTLGSADGGTTWTLGNLTNLTLAEGAYVLTLSGADAGITDAVGNTMDNGFTVSDAWSADTTAPSADVVDVAPDPRTGPVDVVRIVFSEAVTGFGIEDLQLLRRAPGGGVTNVLTPAQTLATTDDGRTWELRGLEGVTAADGNYTLTLVAGVSGISDLAGNSLPADASDAWDVSTTRPAATVAGRHVFYNGSSYDAVAPATGSADDAAIAPDKSALLPGQTATLANYTSYVFGINGLMLDVAGLWAGRAGAPQLSAADFVFRAGTGGDPGSWAAAPAPAVSVRPGEGAGGADRVTLTWDNGALKNVWLQVTLKANDTTGLAADDVFYFGNLVGETGDAPTNGTIRVNAIDVAAVKRHLTTTTVPIGNPADFNRDGRVNALDIAAVKGNLTRTIEVLAPTGVATAQALGSPSMASVGPFSDGAVSEGTTSRVWQEEEVDLLGRA